MYQVCCISASGARHVAVVAADSERAACKTALRTLESAALPNGGDYRVAWCLPC